MQPPSLVNEQRQLNCRFAAFTLTELVVVIGIVALWTVMLVPALARTQPDTRAFHCLNNHAQLCRAWLMYADDNNGKLATSRHGSEGSTPTRPMWAPGWLDWAMSSANTNTVYLADPRYSILAEYIGRDARLFKCPADHFISSVQRARGWNERVRSMSQNLYAADANVSSGPVNLTVFKSVTTLSGLRNPTPAETCISIDEHPDSINEGVMFASPSSTWIDLPANCHDGGAGVAFADGHTEIHRWQTSVLKFPVVFSFPGNTSVPADDPDLLWVRYHTPRN